MLLRPCTHALPTLPPAPPRQVKALMAAPESLDAAVARVKRQVGGGGGGGDDSGARRAAAGACPARACFSSLPCSIRHAQFLTGRECP